MPVHFTCPHCAQLLSVARRKVGQPVRCVKCGGGVIVPPPVSGPDEPSTQTDAKSSLEATAASTDSGVSENGATLKQTVSQSANTGIQLWDVWHQPVAVTRLALYSVGALLIGVAIASFLLGWLLGNGDRSFASEHAAGPGAKYQIHGQLTFLTGNGQQAPDSESVVIALPVRNRPDEKINSSSLRPDVVVPGQNEPAVMAVRSLGGDFARTDAAGQYELNVGAPGPYYLLFLSAHVSRSPHRVPTTREIVELGYYFKQATELLGENDFVWSREVIRNREQIDRQFRGDR